MECNSGSFLMKVLVLKHLIFNHYSKYQLVKLVFLKNTRMTKEIKLVTFLPVHINQ